MKTSEGRNVYLDNIRNMLVYAVVFFHIVCMFAYPMVFWWPVVDREGSSMFFEIIIFTMDIFLMPVLLFIAALFIIPSLKSRSAAGYVKKRFQRLLIPVFVFTFCAGDFFHQFLLMRLGGSVPDYARIFIDYWRDFIDSGIVSYIGEGETLSRVGFNMLHTWFLSFLFFLTLLVVAAVMMFRIKEKEQKKIDARKNIIVKTLLFALLSGFFFCGLMIWLSIHGINLHAWMRIAGIIQFRVNQFFMLVPLFFFGLYVYRKDWLTRGDIGSWKLWGTLTILFLLPIVYLGHAKYFPGIQPFLKTAEHNMLTGGNVPGPVVSKEFEQVFTLIHFLMLPACIFLLMFFLSFAKRFVNRQNPITAFCSKHSINVYILHYIPVIMLQYSFLKLQLPPAITVLAIMIIVIPACLWLSHRLVYPHSLAAIGLFAVLKLVSLYLGFNFYHGALLALLAISFTGAVVESLRLAVASRNGARDLDLPSRCLPPEG